MISRINIFAFYRQSLLAHEASDGDFSQTIGLSPGRSSQMAGLAGRHVRLLRDHSARATMQWRALALPKRRGQARAAYGNANNSYVAYIKVSRISP
jgi:hypothetical protein